MVTLIQRCDVNNSVQTKWDPVCSTATFSNISQDNIFLANTLSWDEKHPFMKYNNKIVLVCFMKKQSSRTVSIMISQNLRIYYKRSDHEFNFTLQAKKVTKLASCSEVTLRILDFKKKIMNIMDHFSDSM